MLKIGKLCLIILAIFVLSNVVFAERIEIEDIVFEKSIKIGSGASSTNIQTVLTSSDEEIPTSKAVIDYINSNPASSTVGFSAHRSFNQTNALDSTVYVAKYDVELYDSNSAYNTNTWKYTIPITGEWQINVLEAIDKLDDGNWMMAVVYQIAISDGATNQVARQFTSSSTADSRSSVNISTLIPLTKGDIIYVGSFDNNTTRDIYMWGGLSGMGRSFNGFSAFLASSLDVRTNAMIGFVADRNDGQSNVSANVWYTGTYSNEIYDSENAYNPATYSYTIPKTGMWQITLKDILEEVDGSRQAVTKIDQVTDGGATTNRLSTVVDKSAADNSDVSTYNAGIYSLTVGDVISAYLFDNNTTRNTLWSPNTYGANQFSAIFVTPSPPVGSTYVRLDSGDVVTSSYDWVIGDLTLDSVWRTISIRTNRLGEALVPANAVKFDLAVGLQNPNVPNVHYVRTGAKRGYSLTTTTSALMWFYNSVAPPTNGLLEYYGVATDTAFSIRVMGYWY